MSASGADSHGYVTQADRWIERDLVKQQPWVNEVPWPHPWRTSSPIGYRPTRRDLTATVPVYAPGLPLLMAGAKLVGGPCAPFWVVPFCGAVLVLTTFAIGRRLADATTGLVAAWLIAISPAYLYMLMWPMADAPVATAWALAFFFALGSTLPSAALAGLATAMAILIRPNLVLGAGILGLGYLWSLARAEADRRAFYFGRVLLFGSLASIGVIVTLSLNFHLYGSPLETGYGRLTFVYRLGWLGENLARYPRWLVESETPLAIFGIVALFLPTRHLWPSLRDRASLVTIALFVLSVWVPFLMFFPFDQWWYLRFLLATWPFMMLGSAAVVLAVARKLPRPAQILIAVAVLALGFRQWAFARDHVVFELWKYEYRYPAVARHVAELTEPRSVVFAMQHSGSLRAYADRVTLRYDFFDPEWLDPGLDWLEERGVRAYLVVDDEEMPVFEKRFAGTRSIERVRTPLLTYVGTSKVFVFDLQRPLDATRQAREVVEDFSAPRCHGGTRPVPEIRLGADPAAP